MITIEAGIYGQHLKSCACVSPRLTPRSCRARGICRRQQNQRSRPNSDGTPASWGGWWVRWGSNPRLTTKRALLYQRATDPREGPGAEARSLHIPCRISDTATAILGADGENRGARSIPGSIQRKNGQTVVRQPGTVQDDVRLLMLMSGARWQAPAHPPGWRRARFGPRRTRAGNRVAGRSRHSARGSRGHQAFGPGRG